jgi:hypothetical protein
MKFFVACGSSEWAFILIVTQFPHGKILGSMTTRVFRLMRNRATCGLIRLQRIRNDNGSTI